MLPSSQKRVLMKTLEGKVAIASLRFVCPQQLKYRIVQRHFTERF
jgi:hypothetical protein